MSVDITLSKKVGIERFFATSVGSQFIIYISIITADEPHIMSTLNIRVKFV